MAVFPDGKLHCYYEGKDIGTTFSNLPVDTPLYGVIGTEWGTYKIGENENILVNQINYFILPGFCSYGYKYTLVYHDDDVCI